MSKTLLLLGASSESLHAIIRARELGFRTLVLDRNPRAPGAAAADAFLPLSIYDEREVVNGLRTWKANGGEADGVICVGADAPRTVAAIGELFGLPAVSMETARLATDKLAMKERLRAAGIPVPWFAPLRDARDLRDVMAERTGPLVIKPVDSRGARGVLRLSPGSDPDRLFAMALAESPSARVMVEAFLSGPQISTEGLMIQGRGAIPGFSDRNYEFLERFSPYIIENGGDLPSFLPEAAQRELRDLTAAAALALGLEHGPVKGDMLWHKGKAYVIEIAARHSGGYFITHLTPWNTGVDLLGASIRMSMGDTPDPDSLLPGENNGVCQRFLFAEPGLVISVSGREEAERIPGVRYLEIRVKEGDVIPPVTSHPARPGLVITTADTREKAQAAAIAAVNAIRIVTRAHRAHRAGTA